ncbi:MAG: DUF1318 domain-containing protein [Magnetococcales bacterium]|nr:DUF1318 domain-containing protein [Magnetococcales bacterium]
MKSHWKRGVALVLSLVLAGCGSGPLVGITVVDERTALENQVLGSYESLGREMQLVASVRGIDPQGKLVEQAATPPGKMKVVRAMQRSAFNRDDLVRFKKEGWIGEANDGRLLVREGATLPESERKMVEALIGEENSDREAIIRRVLESNEGMKEEDLQRIRRTFASMRRDQAQPGEWLQEEDGKWRQKP